MSVRLGLNIDHIATLRQARKGFEPSVLSAALEGIKGGAKSITVHLREDRRHIQDEDVLLLKKLLPVSLNLEMSVARNVFGVALRVRPAKACLVPEKRQELTTEGGLDVVASKRRIAAVVGDLKQRGVEVSLFVNPNLEQIQAACEIDSDAVELHTGEYACSHGERRARELKRLRKAASFAHMLGLQVNAGHGLNYDNVKPVARLPHVEELNIGHSIISRAVFVGIRQAVKEMVGLLENAQRLKRW
jgi:pyridoxine 5-phosphate synthase